MRSLAFVFFAALALTACMSTLHGAYDDHSREQCERESEGRGKPDCPTR